MPFPVGAGCIGARYKRSGFGDVIVLLLHRLRTTHKPYSANRAKVGSVSEHQRIKAFLGVDPSRRSFIAKFAGAVFAVPLVSSFALDGIAQASPDKLRDHPLHQHHGNQGDCKQYLGNQTLHNQWLYNQTMHNQCISNQHLHNQHLHNQSCGNQQHHHKHGHGAPWDDIGNCMPSDHHHHRRGWLG
jgi:hypothetical protein